MNATPEMEWIDTNLKVQETIERVQAIRDAVRYKMEIEPDFHGLVHKGMTKRLMKELEPFMFERFVLVKKLT